MDRERTAELLDSAREGSREAVAVLVGRCAPKLLSLIRMRLGRELRASLESRDILQATLLKAVERGDQLRAASSESYMAWLARIADNQIRDQLDYLRRDKRDAARAVSLDNGATEVATELRSALGRLILGEQELRLERALESLPSPQREVIVLRRLEELSYAEIAEVMGRSPDACRMLFARAMAALTVAMGEEG